MSSIHAYQNYQIRQLESNSPDLIVASILLVRLTTTRKQSSTAIDSSSSSSSRRTQNSNTNLIRIVDVLREMGITKGQLPDVLQPPDDVMSWNRSLDITSRRLIPSKL